MKSKLENLISFDDFKSSWKAEQAKLTRRTGIDILKEGVEEIIPEGIPELPRPKPKYGIDYDEKIKEIEDFIDSEEEYDEDITDEIVNILRETLLEMEQQGVVEYETTDELDDKHDGDWSSWIKDVINLPDFPEEGLNNVLEIIYNKEELVHVRNIEDLEQEEDDEFEEEEDEFEEDELEDDILPYEEEEEKEEIL